MFFTIEPMINLGRPHVKILSDGWTAVTRDRSLSAQFEHTVGVTETGVEIFTLSPRGLHHPPYAAGGHGRPMTKAPVSQQQAGEDAPHYFGHRERLRDRFKSAGGEALADYEMLELILFRAIPRRDVKPLAKALLARFGSFAEVVAAPVRERLKEVESMTEAAIIEVKIVQAAAQRFAKSSLEKRRSLASFSAVLDYCRTAMAFLDREEFRILFLDKKNALIADEVQSTRDGRSCPGLSARSHAPRLGAERHGDDPCA